MNTNGPHESDRVSGTHRRPPFASCTGERCRVRFLACPPSPDVARGDRPQLAGLAGSSSFRRTSRDAGSSRTLNPQPGLWGGTRLESFSSAVSGYWGRLRLGADVGPFQSARELYPPINTSMVAVPATGVAGGPPIPMPEWP
jgi:hypothetical protein